MSDDDHQMYLGRAIGTSALLSIRRQKIRPRDKATGEVLNRDTVTVTLELEWSGVIPGKPIFWRECWNGLADKIPEWITISAEHCPNPDEPLRAVKDLTSKVPQGILRGFPGVDRTPTDR